MEKIYYVYELINLLGTVEYVGMSSNPKKRLWQHKAKKGNSTGVGYFQGRQDLLMNIIKTFNNKREALDFEHEMQIFWGLETSKEKISKAAKSASPESIRKMAEALKGRIPYNKIAVVAIIDGKEYDFKSLSEKYKLSIPYLGRLRKSQRPNIHNIPFVYD
jgi:predicted GIY-YIG superfamily endonuclease